MDRPRPTGVPRQARVWGIAEVLHIAPSLARSRGWTALTGRGPIRASSAFTWGPFASPPAGSKTSPP